jgi:hypothetical protein
VCGYRTPVPQRGAFGVDARSEILNFSTVNRTPMSPSRQIIRTACAFTAIALGACQSDAVVMPEHQHHTNPTIAASVSGAVMADVARLRNLIAPLHTISAATAAGFGAAISPCVASPAGGMGYHYADMSRIDATVTWNEPEILVFAPSPDAKDGVKLGAVEYIVPKALVAQPPVLFGETFVEGGPENSLWTLHVWIGINNPSGLFAPWNPTVACE